MTQERRAPAKPNLWQVISSVLAAFFGVQSEANRQRDFTGGNAAMFIAVGIVMTVLLVLGLILLVRVILAQAGV